MKKTAFTILITIWLLFIPISAQAIFYGNKETDYNFAGYYTIELSTEQTALCGITYIAPNIGITAAHCLTTAKQVFPVDPTTSNKVTALNFATNPNYFESFYLNEAAKNDIAVVNLKNSLNINTYAQIKTPKEGCNYYIVGFGRDENGQRLNKKGIGACIENINNWQAEITFSESGNFCTGDSGSGVYEKGTNNLVGVVSTFDSETTCDKATTYFMARPDYNIDFINKYSNSAVVLEKVETPDSANINSETNTTTQTPKHTSNKPPTLLLALIFLGFFVVLPIAILTGLLVLVIKIIKK